MQNNSSRLFLRLLGILNLFVELEMNAGDMQKKDTSKDVGGVWHVVDVAGTKFSLKRMCKHCIVYLSYVVCLRCSVLDVHGCKVMAEPVMCRNGHNFERTGSVAFI